MDQVMFVLGEEVTSFKLCKFKIGRLGSWWYLVGWGCFVHTGDNDKIVTVVNYYLHSYLKAN